MLFLVSNYPDTGYRFPSTTIDTMHHPVEGENVQTPERMNAVRVL